MSQRNRDSTALGATELAPVVRQGGVLDSRTISKLRHVSARERTHRPLHELHPAAMRRFTIRGPVGGGAKRAFDLAIAIPLLIMLIPILLAVSFLVAVTSKGPVIFVQRRVGYRGRPFLIYKFRTMRSREDGALVRQASRTDDRITPVGRILRKLSIDELPQLLNVIGGEMSLIGPRPHAVTHDRQFEIQVDAYRLRRLAKPGITGLAQVNGSRGEIKTLADVERRTHFDARYALNWSLRRDIEILFRTAGLIVRDRNAY